jgi:aminopeptidase N
MRAAEPGSDHQLTWVLAFLGSARTDAHVAVARALLEGTETLPDLSLDTDLRWSIVRTLSALGSFGDDEIQAESERDATAAGARAAATARALAPTAKAKAEAWRLATVDDTVPNAMQEAVIAGFSHPTQGALVAPYAQTYFESVRAVWDRRTSELAQNVVVGLFPSWTSTITPETVAAADAFLATEDLPTALARLVSEGRADVVRALAARAADANAAAG